jgi:hypothetical protein
LSRCIEANPGIEPSFGYQQSGQLYCCWGVGEDVVGEGRWLRTMFNSYQLAIKLDQSFKMRSRCLTRNVRLLIGGHSIATEI